MQDKSAKIVQRRQLDKNGALIVSVQIHPAELPLEQFEKSCQFEFSRRGGPGGQHRNKVETAVIVTHKPTGISAESNRKRNQGENRTQAIFNLRIRLAVFHRIERDSLPSPLWNSRNQNGAILINENHNDFPAMLSEALDVIARNSGDLAETANELKTTSSQLIKLLKKEPAAWNYVSQLREQSGLRRLH